MTVYSMFQSKTAQVEGQTLTIEEALRKRSFGKIYLETKARPRYLIEEFLNKE